MDEDCGFNSKKVALSNQIQIQTNNNAQRILTPSEQKQREQELSDKKKKALHLSNHNLIEKQRHKVNRAAHNSFKPTKDSQGRNIKQHFGTWKYFVDKQKGDEKVKFYISNDCIRLPYFEGVKVAKREEATKDGRNRALNEIRQVGL